MLFSFLRRSLKVFVIPAIDIKDGKCVRLLKGRKEERTDYYEDPLDAAKRWAEYPLRRVHVVDLDGAFEGKPVNREKVIEISDYLHEREVECEIGGGMREAKDVRDYLEGDVDRVVLGTMAVHSLPLFVDLASSYPREINLALDCRGDDVVVKGWVEEGGLKAADLLGRLQNVPFGEVVYTEVSRDGTLEGIEADGLSRMVEISPRPVIASGGVASLEDVKVARDRGAWGIIIGKALYDGRVDLQEALAAAE